jgi:hypothetical protein
MASITTTAIFHRDALFTGVTGWERLTGDIEQLRAALDAGKSSCYVGGRTRRGRKAMQATLAAWEKELAR